MSCVIMYGVKGTGSPKLLAWTDGITREFMDRATAQPVGVKLVTTGCAEWWEIVPLPTDTPPKPTAPTG